MEGVLNFMSKTKKSSKYTKKISLLAFSMLLILALPACGNAQNVSAPPSAQQEPGTVQTENEIFDKAVNDLKSGEAYAVIKINPNRSLLLVAPSVYNDNGNMVAAQSNIYYVKDGSLTSAGEVRSLGTAYPISYDESGIYTGSNNEIKKFSIDDRSGKIQSIETLQVTYDKDGNAAYTKEEAGKTATVTEEEYTRLMQKYGNAEVVNFTAVK